MVSPIFRAFPDSEWREDVEVTWRYLLKNYDIADSTLASTHIHIGLETGYTFAEVKQIAQAVIHFESAFEGLVPRARRGNHYVKSNWLDAPGLGRANKSRSESIATIEAVPHPRALLELLHPMDPSGSCHDRCYGWNFYSWLEKRSIEFRKPPASMSAKEVLSWAELAMSFVQAAISCNSSQELQRIPPTGGGLRYFLRKYASDEPGVNEPGRLERLWRGKDLDVVLEPIPQAQDVPGLDRPQLEPEMESRLRRMAAADKRRAQSLIKMARRQLDSDREEYIY
jgi:Putative amidoligase enzyme